MCGADCFLMLLSVLFPPIGVWVKRGICSGDSLINIALCCLGFLPGLLHAWYIILQNPDPYDGYGQVADHEGGRQGTTYYVVSHTGPAPRQNGMNYGTVPQQQPSGGQFPNQQTGVTNQNAPKNNGKSAGGSGGERQGGEGSNSQPPEGPPPTYADVIKGDHKVQNP